MERKRLFLGLGCTLLILLTCASAAAFVTYRLLQSPELRTGLNDTASTLGDMVGLQKLLLVHFPADAIQINLKNQQLLQVTLVNSEVDMLSREELEDQAREIALFIHSTFDPPVEITHIQIEFKKEIQLFILTTHQSTTFTFDVNKLELNEQDV